MSGKRNVRVVVVGIEGEINLGFIVRLCANFSVDELVLVEPKVPLDSDIVRRFAARGAWFLDRVKIVSTLEEALNGSEIAACTSARVGGRSDVLRHAFTVREFAENIASRYQSIAVVFGRESVGLTRDEIAKCDVLVHIPANPDYPVLNLSHAVAIVLYELYTSLRRIQRLDMHERARRETLERIYNNLTSIATHIVDDERLEHVEATIKHLLWGCPLTGGEASSLYYFSKKLRRIIEECISARTSKPSS